MRWCIGLLLVTGPAVADAEPPRIPVGAVINVGSGDASRHDGWSDDSVSDVILSAQLDLGFRFHHRAMAGVHVGFASGMGATEATPMSMFNYSDDYVLRPLQLGVSGLVMVLDRVYVSPWLGVQRGWRELERRTTTFNGMPGRGPEVTDGNGEWEAFDGTTPAFGLSVGGDSGVVGDHRISVSASLTHALLDQDDRFTYTSFAVTVGYRFWSQ